MLKSTRWLGPLLLMAACTPTVAPPSTAALDEVLRTAVERQTKPVTAVAVMQLVEAGKVELDALAATYLPELAPV